MLRLGLSKRFILLCFIAGCGSPGSKSASNANNAVSGLDPADYDQSCTVDADCVLVHAGSPCTCNTCANDAIRQSDLPAWQSAIAAAECGDLACPPIDCAEPLVAACIGASCVAQSPPASTNNTNPLCERTVDVGQCWGDCHCADGEGCEGAFICPDGASCGGQADSPGECTP